LKVYDLLVIGGGIHGAGVAQAAAAAGHGVAVLEQFDQLARGTSSRSSKLIHGGLRYLETGQFALVRECLRERELLLRNAPELVRLKPFYIPVYDRSRHKPLMLRAGLSLYALLGGLGPQVRFSTLPSPRWDTLDGLETQGLQRVFRYFDAQTDDAALTRAVMHSACTLGAELFTGHRVEALALHEGGIEVTATAGERPVTLRARVAVNAAGPWVGDVLARAEPVQQPLPFELVQGTHILVPHRVQAGIYYVEAADGRPVFIMPWRDAALIGTTETRYQGDPADPRPLQAETDYLLAAFRRHFPQAPDAVLERFAGLRVLPAGGDPNRRPRDTILQSDRTLSPRLVSLYGGKLTAYRATAERVLHALQLPERPHRAETRRLHLPPQE
jgi:glycerol-3-phosphate dehydrogenase